MLQSSDSYRAGKPETKGKAGPVCWEVRYSFVLCLPDSLTMKDAVVTKLQEELREVKEKTGDEVRVSLHSNRSSVQTTLLMIID